MCKALDLTMVSEGHGFFQTILQSLLMPGDGLHSDTVFYEMLEDILFHRQGRWVLRAAIFCETIMMRVLSLGPSATWTAGHRCSCMMPAPAGMLVAFLKPADGGNIYASAQWQEHSSCRAFFLERFCRIFVTVQVFSGICSGWQEGRSSYLGGIVGRLRGNQCLQSVALLLFCTDSMSCQPEAQDAP